MKMPTEAAVAAAEMLTASMEAQTVMVEMAAVMSSSKSTTAMVT